MWRLSLALGDLFLLSAEYSGVIGRGLAGNLSDLAVSSSQYDILLGSETLVSDMNHVSNSVALSCAVARYLGPEGWLHRGISPAEIGCEMLVLVLVV